MKMKKLLFITALIYSQFYLYSNANDLGDIKIIKQIEKSIKSKIKLKKSSEDDYFFTNYYVLNKNKFVIELILNNLTLINIKVIKPLKYLNSLTITNSNIKNFNHLIDFKRLRKINFSGSNIKNLSFVKELSELKELILDSIFDCKDFSAISYLKQLDLLSLEYSSNLKDICFLRKITNLKALFIGNTDIKNISILKNLKNLKRIGLDSLGVTDFSVLKQLKNLESLALRFTKFSDITILKNHNKLKKVYFEGVTFNELPEWIADWNLKLNLRKIFEECLIYDPPKEIIMEGREAIKKYFNKKRMK